VTEDRCLPAAANPHDHGDLVSWNGKTNIEQYLAVVVKAVQTSNFDYILGGHAESGSW